jgi:multiple sugar transport system ATP-binding protein
MLELRGIHKSYGEVQALRDLSLAVDEGEIFVLLGPTGAGKTTTLKTAAGLVRPDRGQVFINGEDMTEAPPVARNISFVFENYNLFPIYNVYRNIAFALKSRVMNLDGTEIDRRIRAVAGDLHIEHLLDRPTQTLSGGETQRVALARALVRQAEINLFDEPLSNLDLKLREELRVEFRELHKRHHSTTFYVTHDHDSAVSVADRIGILHEGRLHQVGTPDELIAAPRDITVASLVNYPAINLLDCRLQGRSLVLDGGTTLMELNAREAETVAGRTEETEFAVGIKPGSIQPGAVKGWLQFTGKVLHIEYQGYNKIVNLEFSGGTLRLRTNRTVRKQYGESIDFSFRRDELFLFSRKSGERIL